ncbi:MAG: glycosyltransferase family 4 protein [Deltaproteobacteria bacterium]|nr:glycosyltransferase family 4 protein [Deltaproteobacteria bacterium]
MNALLVDQYREIGGGQAVFLQVLDALVEAGVHVEAATPGGGGLERAIRSKFFGVRHRAIDELALTAGKKGLRDVARLARYTANFVRRFDARGFDHIYVNGPRLFPAFLALASATRARFTYHLHIDHSRAEKALIAALLHHPRTHAVLVNSPFIRERLERALGPLARSRKLVLLENALTREQSKLPFESHFQGPLRAVVVGRVVPEKGHATVIELAARHPQIEFHILGDADFGERAFMDSLRARAGSNVTFHGRVPDVHAAIRELGAQLNLVPSAWDEPFGLVAIEGMAMSCLTLTSGRGGLADISRRTGARVCDSLEAWSRTLSEIERTPREQLEAQARAQHDAVLAAYAWPRFDRELRAVFGA